MKVLVHDGIGVWLAARRLNQGKFAYRAAIDSNAADQVAQGAGTIGLLLARAESELGKVCTTRSAVRLEVT